MADVPRAVELFGSVEVPIVLSCRRYSSISECPDDSVRLKYAQTLANKLVGVHMVRAGLSLKARPSMFDVEARDKVIHSLAQALPDLSSMVADLSSSSFDDGEVVSVDPGFSLNNALGFLPPQDDALFLNEMTHPLRKLRRYRIENSEHLDHLPYPDLTALISDVSLPDMSDHGDAYAKIVASTGMYLGESRNHRSLC